MDDIYFKNRKEAGWRLANLLEKYRSQNGIILALPRGGVVVASEIAKNLCLPLGIIVVRKIGHPLNPEYAIAAISESGQIVKNEDETEQIEPLVFQKMADRGLEEAQRRRQKYWGKRPKIDLKNKIAIIVDDGLATGLTMKAAILEIKSQKPKKIVVAVPVAPPETTREIKKIADEFVTASIPDDFLGAVGAYYHDFPQISDEEVVEMLK